MALTQAALKAELMAVVPAASKSAAATNLAQAYADYLKLATANAVATNAAWLDATFMPAMRDVLAFQLTDDGTPAEAASAIRSGMGVGWAAAVATPALFITGATVILAPTFAGVEAAMATAMGTLEADLSAAMDRLATAIHTHTLISPTATFGVPTFPIL